MTENFLKNGYSNNYCVSNKYFNQLLSELNLVFMQ